MIGALAERVYGRTQPFRHAIYLNQHGRGDEGVAAMRRLAASGPRQERAWAYAGLAARLPDFGEALRAGREAVRLDPNLPLAWWNLSGAEQGLGWDERYLADDRETLRRLDRGADRTIVPNAGAVIRRIAQRQVDEALGDYGDAFVQMEATKDLKPYAGIDQMYGVYEAIELAGLHDLARARQLVDFAGSSDADVMKVGAKLGSYAMPRVALDEAAGDWPGALMRVRAYDQAAAADSTGQFARPTFVWPILAEAYARTGDDARADAVLQAMPPDCYPCQRARGRIAAFRRRWPEAQAAFAEATRQAPSLPMAYAEWGAMLLEKGDLDSAIAKLSLAREKGPHFADPLELWGEALMRKGDVKGAVAKFREAATYAPRWERNQQHLKQALALQAKAGGHG